MAYTLFRIFSIDIIIWQEGGFDKAVKNVDGVVHMASPFHGNVKEPQGRSWVEELFVEILIYAPVLEFLQPAIRGTVGILKSVHEHGYV